MQHPNDLRWPAHFRHARTFAELYDSLLIGRRQEQDQRATALGMKNAPNWLNAELTLCAVGMHLCFRRSSSLTPDHPELPLWFTSMGRKVEQELADALEITFVEANQPPSTQTASL